MSVLRSKEKISRISVIFAFAGVVGSERKNFLPRRLPNFLFPHYRSKRKFVAIPVQRVAGGLSNVSLAKGKKAAYSGLKAPPRSLYVRKNPNKGSLRLTKSKGSLRLTKSKFLPRCQNPQFCGFAPRGKLVGECLPQTLLCGLRRKNISVRQAVFLRELSRKYLTDQPIFCDK